MSSLRLQLLVASSVIAVLSGCGTTPTQCEGAECEAKCPPAQRLCNSICRDVQTDSTNCGACGTVCAAGQVCSTGQCTPTCAAPLNECSAKCVNLKGDPENCGTCGKTCGSGFCVDGVCGNVCPAPLTECPVKRCFDTLNDPGNCGGCGLTCSPLNATGGRCTNGTCAFAACLPGFIDCDNNPINGCEAPLNACPAQLVSVSMDGGAANGRSYGAAIDNSGTKIVFISEATNLVPGDTNGVADAFLRDLTAGTTTRISTLPNGGQITTAPVVNNSFGQQVAISGDGRVIALLTSGPMIAPDTNGTGNDVVILEADGGRRYGMLNNTGGQPNGNTESCCLFMSSDDRFVSYSTRGGGSLVPPGDNEFNIFTYDRRSGRVTHMSPNASGGYVNSGAQGWNAFTHNVSSNGRYTTFASLGYNYVANEGFENCANLYVRDLLTGFTTRMSTDNNGVLLGCNGAGGLAVSPDGTLATMITNRLPPGGRYNLYSRDVLTRVWTQLSFSADGGVINQDIVGGTTISDDGNEIGLNANASNLTNDDTNGAITDCYAYNRETRTFTRLNGPVAVPSPDGGTGCVATRLNAPGTHAVFETQDSLRPADTHNNTDVYVRRVR